MPNDIDLSNDSLLARRALAEKAMYALEQIARLDFREDNPPKVVIADIDEILRLRGEVDRLEKEVAWLAARCHEFCDFNDYCNECALYPGNINFPHPDCGVKLVDEGRARARFTKHTVDWRKAVREAVEKTA